MLSKIQNLVEGLFESSAGIFRRAGFSPNSITSIGFLLAVVASTLFSVGLPSLSTWVAVILSLVLAGYFDALDGAMARRFQQASRVGGVLDSVLDRLGEISLYSSLAIGGLVDFRLSLWAMSASLMVSYVRARVEAEGTTMKGVGLAERPERLLILLGGTVLFPAYGNALEYGVGLVAVLASLTFVERFYKSLKVLSVQKSQTC